MFARLREVRKQVAAEEAVPVYAVCTNEQLAEMAKSRAPTVGDLKKIDGFGEPLLAFVRRAETRSFRRRILQTIEGLCPEQARTA